MRLERKLSLAQGARRIGFREFMAALPLMAEDRGISVEEVRTSTSYLLKSPLLINEPLPSVSPLLTTCAAGSSTLSGT